MTRPYDERLSVAPMLDLTDRHFRRLLREITKKTVLYTEMIPAQAVVFSDASRFLKFSPVEKPLVLQFGGSDPEILAKACKIASDFDFDGINLNAGCPSSRVAAGNFGASLMAQPSLTAECLRAMIENSKVPVTIKTRIALEEKTADSDGYEALADFTKTVRRTGVQRIIVHARKARLNLTPKQNRERPALRYDLVYDLKRAFPDTGVVINGNINSIDEAMPHFDHVDGVMIGRAFYADPYAFAAVDNLIFKDDAPVKTRREVVEGFLPYMESELARGTSFKEIAPRLFGLFKGVSGAAVWRRTLGEMAQNKTADVKTVAQLLNKVISSGIF